MERCGLSVGAPPPRDVSLSGEEQWAQAQSYWQTILQEWRSQAQSVDIIQEEGMYFNCSPLLFLIYLLLLLLLPLSPCSFSPSPLYTSLPQLPLPPSPLPLPPFYLVSTVSSGSGISGSGDEAILDLASPQPQLQQSQASWLQQLRSWQQDYTTWATHVASLQTNDNAFPTSDSGRIVAGLMPEESSSSVLSNSRGWNSLLADWGTANTAYNETYSGACST